MQYKSLPALLTLLGPTLTGATILWRGEKRDPQTIYDAGGFHSWGSQNPSGPDPITDDNLEDVLFRHADGYYGDGPNRDPFIPTSTLEVVAEIFARKYMYAIESNDIMEKNIYDVNKILGDRSPNPEECEMAIRDHIPWHAIREVWELMGSHGGYRQIYPEDEDVTASLVAEGVQELKRRHDEIVVVVARSFEA